MARTSAEEFRGQTQPRAGRIEVARPLAGGESTRPAVFTLTSPATLWSLVKEAIDGWREDRVASMGAALAYYTAFSIAPLLIVVVAVAGLVFGRGAAHAALIAQLGGLLGTSAGKAIDGMLTSASDLGTGSLAMVVGLVTLLVAATTAFVELQDDLDRIWKAEPRVGSGVLVLLKSRLLSFAMVLFIGFLLTVSLALSAALTALSGYFFDEMTLLLEAINFVVSLAVITVLFAMIYKILPNVAIAWRDVWVGAAITAVLFTVGKFLIGLYIGKSSVASSFGAAGPFVVILVWIYYSTQIFLLGAEFTAKYAKRRRSALSGNSAQSSPGQRASPGVATPAGKTQAEEAFLVSARRPSAALSNSPDGPQR